MGILNVLLVGACVLIPAAQVRAIDTTAELLAANGVDSACAAAAEGVLPTGWTRDGGWWACSSFTNPGAPFSGNFFHPYQNEFGSSPAGDNQNLFVDIPLAATRALGTLNSATLSGFCWNSDNSRGISKLILQATNGAGGAVVGTPGQSLDCTSNAANQPHTASLSAIDSTATHLRVILSNNRFAPAVDFYGRGMYDGLSLTIDYTPFPVTTGLATTATTGGLSTTTTTTTSGGSTTTTTSGGSTTTTTSGGSTTTTTSGATTTTSGGSTTTTTSSGSTTTTTSGGSTTTATARGNAEESASSAAGNDWLILVIIAAAAVCCCLVVLVVVIARRKIKNQSKSASSGSDPAVEMQPSPLNVSCGLPEATSSEGAYHNVRRPEGSANQAGTYHNVKQAQAPRSEGAYHNVKQAQAPRSEGAYHNVKQAQAPRSEGVYHNVTRRLEAPEDEDFL